MKLRLAAAFLWFYYGWYATTLVADLFGFERGLGPVVGFIGAVIVLRDPIRLRWSQRSAKAVQARAVSASTARIS